MKKLPILLLFALLTLLACGPKWSICEKGSIEEQISCLNNLPVKNITHSAVMIDYKVFYSVTTSPERIKNLQYTFKTLDFSIPEKVFVVVPAKYRNKEEYNLADIERIKNYHEKIVILRPAYDLGPAMKLIPTVEELRKTENPAKTFVMTIDDEIGYPWGLPIELLQHAIRHHTVVGGSGQDSRFWGINHFPGTLRACKKSELSRCDVVEGFHGIVYPIDLVDTEMIKAIVLRDECRNSDDLAISYVLALSGVKRFVVKNQYTENLLPFAHGNGSDALHVTDDNEAKYQKCMKVLSP